MSRKITDVTCSRVEYVSPEIAVIDVVVEKGFASSNEELGEDDGQW